MNILKELNSLLGVINIPVRTGVFSSKAPDEYVVITPMNDIFDGYADNKPHYEVQEVRLSLFSKNNYQQRKNEIVKALLAADIMITDRRFIEYEIDTEYYNYAIDVAKEYSIFEGDEE